MTNKKHGWLRRIGAAGVASAALWLLAGSAQANPRGDYETVSPYGYDEYQTDYRGYDERGYDDPWQRGDRFRRERPIRRSGRYRDYRRPIYFDQNHDGWIDLRELGELRRLGLLDRAFARFDVNHDGYLSRREAHHSPLDPRIVRGADHDGDGYLGWGELDHFVVSPWEHAGPRRFR